MGRDINNCACRHTAAVGPWLCYLLALTTTQLIFHSSFFSFSSSSSSSFVSNMYTHILCTFGSTAPFGYLRGICATLKKQCVALRLFGVVAIYSVVVLPRLLCAFRHMYVRDTDIRNCNYMVLRMPAFTPACMNVRFVASQKYEV